jgi:hypothetical protein
MRVLPNVEVIRVISLDSFHLRRFSFRAPHLPCPSTGSPPPRSMPSLRRNIGGSTTSSATPGKLGEKTEFSSILLREPPKAEVLAWKPGMPFVRKVDVVLLTEGKSYAAVVDVSSGKLDSWAELTKDQTPVSAKRL